MNLCCLHGKSQTTILCHYDYHCLATVTKQMLFTKITGHITKLNFKRESQRHQSRILKRAELSSRTCSLTSVQMTFDIQFLFNSYFAISKVGKIIPMRSKKITGHVKSLETLRTRKRKIVVMDCYKNCQHC